MTKILKNVIIYLILSTNMGLGGQAVICGNSILPDTIPSQQNLKYQLELTHQKRKKVKHIAKGRKIKLIYDSLLIKGKIDSISAEHIFIGEKGYSIERMNAIRINLRGFRYGGAGTLLGGIGLGVFGIVITSAGVAMASSGLMMAFIGAAIAGFGVTVAIIGGVAIIASIPMFFIGKKFDFQKKWRLSIVPAES